MIKRSVFGCFMNTGLFQTVALAILLASVSNTGLCKDNRKGKTDYRAARELRAMFKESCETRNLAKREELRDQIIKDGS